MKYFWSKRRAVLWKENEWDDTNLQTLDVIYNSLYPNSNRAWQNFSFEAVRSCLGHTDFVWVLRKTTMINTQLPMIHGFTSLVTVVGRWSNIPYHDSNPHFQRTGTTFRRWNGRQHSQFLQRCLFACASFKFIEATSWFTLRSDGRHLPW